MSLQSFPTIQVGSFPRTLDRFGRPFPTKPAQHHGLQALGAFGIDLLAPNGGARCWWLRGCKDVPRHAYRNGVYRFEVDTLCPSLRHDCNRHGCGEVRFKRERQKGLYRRHAGPEGG